MTNFLPHTTQERQAMLATIGVPSTETLFESIPESIRNNVPVKTLPLKGLSELELQQALNTAAAKNQTLLLESFQGGGAYHRFIPPAVNTLAGRSEFYTAYTPYQPEVSQGTLQMLYEFQTMLSELTGMAVTNASVYDAATAITESIIMAIRATRRNQVWVSQTINPQFKQVLETYAWALDEIAITYFDPDQPLPAPLDPKSLAAVVVQQPDYFGRIHDLETVSQFCQHHKATFIVSVDPVTLSVLAPPGAYGADIVCGDIQPFGNAVNYGGPYGGFIATTQKLIRQLPGRLVGRTTDKNGHTAYTLTLQTREQHIRRDKATSNICTNQSLNVLKASIYLSLVGPQGLKQVATVSAERAHYLASQLTQIPGVSLSSAHPYLYEFTLTLPVAASELISSMAQSASILPGIDLGRYDPHRVNQLLVTVTEMNSWESIARYIDGFKSALQKTQSKQSTVRTLTHEAPSAICASGNAS